MNDTKDEPMNDTDTDNWFGYECFGSCFRKGTGLVLDLRITCAEDHEAPAVPCPVCAAPLVHKATWPARANGYGSRGDSPHYAEGFTDGATTMTNVGLHAVHFAFKALVRAGRTHGQKSREDFMNDLTDDLSEDDQTDGGKDND